MKKEWRERIGRFLSNEHIEVDVVSQEENENILEIQYETSETSTAKEQETSETSTANPQETEEADRVEASDTSKTEKVNGLKAPYVDYTYDNKTSNAAPKSFKSVPADGSIPLTHRMAAKVTAFMLVIVMLVIFVGSVLGAVIMHGIGIYENSQESFEEMMLERVLSEDSFRIVNNVVYDNKVEAEQFCVERNISRVSVSNADTGKELWKFEKETRTPDDHVYTMIHYFSKDAPDTGKMTEYKYLVKVQLSEKFNIEDKYYMIQKLSVLLYNLRFWIYPIGIISFILTIAAFIFLMCSAGRRSGSSQVQPGWGTGIPFDVTTAALGVASIAMIYVISELLYYQVAWIQWIGICAVVGVISIMCLGWIMSFAVRVKLGGWWKNTVIFYALILCWKILKACCRGIIRACKAIGNFVMMIPMVWRTTLGIAVVSIIEFIILATFWGEGDVLFVWWFIGKFIQIQLVLYIAMMLKKLKKGGDATECVDKEVP